MRRARVRRSTRIRSKRVIRTRRAAAALPPAARAPLAVEPAPAADALPPAGPAPVVEEAPPIEEPRTPEAVPTIESAPAAEIPAPVRIEPGTEPASAVDGDVRLSDLYADVIGPVAPVASPAGTHERGRPRRSHPAEAAAIAEAATPPAEPQHEVPEAGLAAFAVEPGAFEAAAAPEPTIPEPAIPELHADRSRSRRAREAAAASTPPPPGASHPIEPPAEPVPPSGPIPEVQRPVEPATQPPTPPDSSPLSDGWRLVPDESIPLPLRPAKPPAARSAPAEPTAHRRHAAPLDATDPALPAAIVRRIEAERLAQVTSVAWAPSPVARGNGGGPQTPGTPQAHPCVSCALPLSASARFCRRCGSPQK